MTDTSLPTSSSGMRASALTSQESWTDSIDPTCLKCGHSESPASASDGVGLSFLRCEGASPPAGTRSTKAHVAHRRIKIERVYRRYLTATEAVHTYIHTNNLRHEKVVVRYKHPLAALCIDFRCGVVEQLSGLNRIGRRPGALAGVWCAADRYICMYVCSTECRN
jgi:hypothetical protein